MNKHSDKQILNIDDDETDFFLGQSMMKLFESTKPTQNTSHGSIVFKTTVKFLFRTLVATYEPLLRVCLSKLLRPFIPIMLQLFELFND